MKHSNWRPILDKSHGESALTTVHEIVAALPTPGTEAVDDASLAGGAAGLAILCAYLAQADYDDGENAKQFLEQAVQAITAAPAGSSFFKGSTGVAWAIAHLYEQLFDAEDDDPTEEFDEALQEQLNQWEGGYDLINGLVGVGVYALERLPRPNARENLETVVTRLHEIAEYGPEGVAWFSGPEVLPDWHRELYPEGYYNLGLAHGIPGIIAFLGEVCTAGIALDRAEPLLAGAVKWLLRQRLPNGGAASFPNWIGRGPQQFVFKLGWCYGDIGVAAALLHAGRCVERPDWEREALDIARRVALREPEKVGFSEAGLCHGAAGRAHIFNRIFQATGEDFFKEAARFWFQRTLELKQPGQGSGGYPALYLNEKNEKSWGDDWGILTGAAGIALALLAAVTNITPAWDQFLLLSIPSGHLLDRRRH
jgi:lantibiotic modifying enzyme